MKSSFMQLILCFSLLLLLHLHFVHAYSTYVVILNSDISETNPVTLTCPVESSYFVNNNTTISWEYSRSLENTASTKLPTEIVSINITSVDKAGTYACKEDNVLLANFTASYFAEPKIQVGNLNLLTHDILFYQLIEF